MESILHHALFISPYRCGECYERHFRLRSAKQIVLIMLVLFDKASLDGFAKAALTQPQPGSGAPYDVVIGTKSA